ncbi:MAG: AAA family ATPase [Clostridia bacterium]|nr:AAA family ATPase [Clostridia bacterium]
MSGICACCGKKCHDIDSGHIPFLVWTEPNICSECVEFLENERSERCHEILSHNEDVIWYVRQTIAPDFPGPGTEYVRLDIRNGALAIGVDTSKVSSEQEENFEKKMEKTSLDYPEVMAEVLQSVCEQDNSVLEIGRIIFHNQQALAYKKQHPEMPMRKQNAFIVGPTGTGKTMSITKTCEYLGIPYTIVDSTELTQTGYVGKDVSSIFEDLVMSANGDLEAAEGGIIVLDEFDKKEAKNSGSGPDVSGKCVLDSLLKAVEGTQITLRDGDVLDTSGITFFALGAYPRLEEIRRERLCGKKSMGFAQETVPILSEKKYVWTDLEKHGLTKELVGRFPCIIEFTNFTEEGYRNILLRSQDSEWKCQKALFADSYGLELEISEAGIQYVVEKAKSYKIGARGLNAVITSLLKDVEQAALSGRIKKKKVVIGEGGKVEYCD